MTRSTAFDLKPGVYWLSFADDTGFLGVVILAGLSFHHALQESHRLGLNPGGEVEGFLLDPNHLPPRDTCCRLLDAAEIVSRDLGGKQAVH